jgi:hypothetical protein
MPSIRPLAGPSGFLLGALALFGAGICGYGLFWAGVLGSIFFPHSLLILGACALFLVPAWVLVRRGGSQE